MFGIGATEMLGVCVTGEIWVQVPRTLRLAWQGTLQRGVCAKDMMLHTIARLGMNGGEYQAVEFAGPGVTALSMPERMTLSNMSAELGAQAGLIAADATTVDYLRTTGVAPEHLQGASVWCSDPDATCELHEFDAGTLPPQVAAPHSPANTRAVGEFGDIKPGIAYIGACTGAKLEDLRAAATVLRGKRVADGVQLMVAPASAREQQQAQREGTLQTLIDAGATVLGNSCGACAGYGASFPANATVISSTARNFKGRMGPASVEVYLASPFTVAASALRGRITDPREVLA
jgi:3-isopropylmalate/(R)-2-methylmalate dehydratase large subunit